MRLLSPALLSLSLLLAAAPASASNLDPWAGLQFLVGDWDGVGSGKPGEATGSFSFKPDLGSKVLIRRSFAQYPPKPGQTAGFRHDDLMIVYLAEQQLKAVYFDNEGHVINYNVTTRDKTATFESQAELPTVPRFKLVYEQKDAATIAMNFSIAPPGQPFLSYLAASAKRAAAR